MKFLFTVFFIIIFFACKKDTSTTVQPLLQDGPMSAQLGKLIYLGDNRWSRSSPYWGRNSNELFITSSTEILRVDFAAQKVEVVENSGGMVTGRTKENSGIIFLGKINNQRGYHLFNYNNNNIEKIISVPENQGTIINIAGNNIFYYSSPVSAPNPPCNGFCWPLPGPFVPATFYHLDKVTQQITNLPNKQFMAFSMDGSISILSSQLEQRLYMFDNANRMIIDSLDLKTFASSFGLFFYSGILHSFELDVLSNITIKNLNTGQVLRQYQTINIALDDFRISNDGTRLYYSGGTLSGNSLKILMYDINTNTEKTIADLPFLQGGATPFDDFVLSDDNKKMITQVGNDLYIKVLD